MSKRLKMLEAEQEQEMRALLGPDAKIETYSKSFIDTPFSSEERLALQKAAFISSGGSPEDAKQALINLGWTPPPENKDQLSTAEQWKNEIHNNVAVIVDPDGDEIAMVEELVEFLADKFGGVA